MSTSPSALPAPSTSAATSPSASTLAATSAVVLPRIQKSAMADKLREAGLDPAHLPRIEKIEHSKLSRVMNTFTASLGIKCKDCHADDFKAWTPNKHIAAHMWNDLVLGLSPAGQDGDMGPLYCDSCHQGKSKLADRSNPDALRAAMNDVYVGTLTRTDGKPHGCPTCHGEPFDPKVLTRWGR